MPNIKIKSMGNSVSTSGLHMGGDRKRRKLEPGEVLFLDENDSLFAILWGTGKLELTMDAPNRPLDFESIEQARLCSPTFKSQSDEDAEKMLDAHEEVMEFMAAQAGPIAHPPGTEPEPGDVDAVDSDEAGEAVDVAALQASIVRDQARLDAALASKVPTAAVSRRAARRERIAQARATQSEALS